MEKKYDYGCVMLELMKPRALPGLKKIISPEDLHEKGFEDETHLTLLYGLHEEVTTQDVKNKLAGLPIGLLVQINGLSSFNNPEFDVLKFDVEASYWIKALNKALMELPNSCKFPEYKAHVTLAYLKPGTAKKYIPERQVSYPIISDHIVYSKPDGTKDRINIKF